MMKTWPSLRGLKKLVKDNEEQINLAVKNKNFQDIRNDAEVCRS